ncbi:MAG: V4R domain-containing protein [Candidatus Thorarchaeota archaeon]
MNSIIQTVMIIHMDGLPLLSIDLDPSTTEGIEGFVNLFGGFSSAINALLKELGHKEIKSITVSDGVLVYSSHNPLLFVVHASDEEYEKFAEILINQIRREFFSTYGDILHDEGTIALADTFMAFKARIEEIYESLRNIVEKYPALLQYLPVDIPLQRLYELLHVGLDIIEGYPDDTIKIVRKLDQYFTEDVETVDKLSYAIGLYSGHMIAKERLKREYVVNLQHVLKLLEEISVVSLDTKRELFNIKLCPICRGKTADRPICGFYSGFIEGALDNPAISVKEIACRAMGNESCQFKLYRK